MIQAGPLGVASSAFRGSLRNGVAPQACSSDARSAHLAGCSDRHSWTRRVSTESAYACDVGTNPEVGDEARSNNVRGCRAGRFVATDFPGPRLGIGFDGLGFAPILRKVMVPGGGTGKLALIDPDSQQTEMVGGFSEQTGYAGGHGEGITSADACRGLLYVTDRGAKLLDILDPRTKRLSLLPN